MSETIKARWLVDNEQTKVAPKTLSTQILNEDGTYFKDSVENSIAVVETEVTTHTSNNDIHVTAAEKEIWNSIEVPSLDGYATEDYVETLYNKLNSSTTLAFYCVEEVTVVINGTPKVYPANSNVSIGFTEVDTFEIVPTSNNSILSLSAFPGALGTFYPWLEGVRQFSNILFDMNEEDMYTKWSQGNQGLYQVQYAQYLNCIFWSDNGYISDVTKRTNYTLYYSAQLPLCYSTIPENTFKTFYMASGVVSDPNWGNPAYLESFANATWATQVFSYYGARTVGLPGLSTIPLPADCRGLMFDARSIENAGIFDATNTTNFGAGLGSWREAFGDCLSLRRLYISNLQVNLNISWSPINYESISYIISAAANTTAITISVSPYTYNLLSESDFELAASKNITIELLTANYVEDKRLSAIDNKVIEIDTKFEELNTIIETKADSEHSHDDVYYTEAEIDAKIEELNAVIDGKADSDHNHDSDYDAYGSASTALDSAKSYTDTAVSGLASTTSVTNAISTHNTSTEAHNDIRTLISDLSTEVNNFLDVDDTTADQLSEVLAMIEANEGTIESLTSNKVNVSDIIDNLTTASTDKVLSANQGVVLKDLIDALQEAVTGKADSSHAHTVSEISDLTATVSELNVLDGATVTTEELNYVDGVTSNIQTQLDNKSDVSHTHDDTYYTETEVDEMLTQKTQVQIITWGADD